MARTQTSQLIVEMLDRVSGPAKAVARSMQGMNERIARASAAVPRVGDRITASLERSTAGLSAARAGVLDAVGAYYSLRAAIGAPIAAAANFETILEDIGQKAGIPVERLGALGERIKQVARETNQANAQIGSAVDALAGRGASVDVAMAAAAPIGKAATAYRAATDDLAAASWSAVDNLKIPADQIGRALDMMATAGKAGAFELRDMAAYFPALGAAYQGLGQSGTGAVADLAAALQVVRKGTGDSSTAATNLANVLQKIYSPATVRAFGKQGVDVFAEMEAAARRGLTPIEAIAELTDKTLKGDLSKMGNLFEDAQVQAGMRSLIQGMDEYRRIRSEAMSAEGVVDADFERRIKTARGAIDRWNARLDDLNTTIGAALVPSLHMLLDAIEPVVGRIAAFVDAHPQLVSNVMLSVGALVAFRGAVAALRFVGLLGKTGALSLLSVAFNSIGGTAARVLGAARASMALNAALAGMAGVRPGTISQTGAALRGLAGVTGLRVVATGVSAVIGAIGAISAPVWLGIAAAVAAVGAAWKYWDRITAIVGGVADAIGTALRPVIEQVGVWLEPAEPIIRRFGEAWKFVDDKIRAVANFVRSLGKGLFTREILTEGEQAELRQRAAQIVTDIIAKIGELPGKLLAVGRDAIQSLWTGMKEIASEVLSWAGNWATEIGNAIAAPLRKLEAARRARVEYMWGTGDAPAAGAAPEIDGARAKGGPVSRGSTYLVGEEGPEPFTASRSGYIHPIGMGAAAAGPVTISPTINISGVSDPRAVADLVMQRLKSETGMAMRAAYADIGLG